MNQPDASTAARKSNRLINETSPYLLQHAYNPVEWFAWDDEAIQQARDLDRPIFLSIGYSACHWCHVMEHESFENDQIASLMNKHFVCIKVDREERPDLDQIYMSSVQIMTRHGGWPMSVFLTPNLKPFFGGTYWPPESRMGMPGFRDILLKVHEAWTDRREDVLRGAEELTEAVIQSTQIVGSNSTLDAPLLEDGMRALIAASDQVNGGFGQAPKFPHPMTIRVLLRNWKRFGNETALNVARLALDKMAHGGIYDHLGGGFHRYSTDARWLAPHFEKMLYDNALLIPAYLEAYQITGDGLYANVVRETLDYVLREMTQPEGGFYSTQDADSEGEEGKFFVWYLDEVTQVLGHERAQILNHCYDVTQNGNWEGKNILNRTQSHAQAAEDLRIDATELANALQLSRQELWQARSERVWPGRDEKILVSWNGLMISAMAQASQVLSEPKYVQAAQDACDFILSRLREPDGRLLHCFKDGRSRFNAYLDDYACLIDGLVDMYQATFDVRYLVSASEFAERMIEKFQDRESGAFFYTSSDHEELIARNKDSQDNATPSGNGMAATALLRLARICSRADLEDTAVRILESLSGQIVHSAMASGQALIALDFLLGPTYEFVIADGPQLEDGNAMLDEVNTRFLPNKVVARLRNSESDSDDKTPSPLELLFKGKSQPATGATTYLCELGVCQEPSNDLGQLSAALNDLNTPK